MGSQREFLLVLRRALLLIIRWIERREGGGAWRMGHKVTPRQRRAPF